jgi:hypothetical protein
MNYICSPSTSWYEATGCETRTICEKGSWTYYQVKLYAILYHCCDEVKMYFPIINKSLLCYLCFVWEMVMGMYQINGSFKQINLMKSIRLGMYTLQKI